MATQPSLLRMIFAPPTPLIQDKWLRIIGYPVVILGMSLIFAGKEWTELSPMLWISLLISSLYTILIWEGCRRIIPAIRLRYPGFANTTKRLLVQVPAMVLYTFLVFLFMEQVMSYCYEPGQEYDEVSPGLTLLILLIPVTFFLLIYESRYFFLEWKKDIQKTEALARAHLLSQFEALKKQLDPHFLFNSLNTLASLIDHANTPAQEYLERLSDVYRYILETRNKATVSLAEEMQFLDAYVYLNKVRFRDNILVENELSELAHQQHIPALSLQLLVENAIKHNVISRDKPLKIRIFEEDGELVVENNKQLKPTLGHSTRVGLQNIRSRYELLNAKPITIINQEDLFRVKLPLLQPISA